MDQSQIMLRSVRVIRFHDWLPHHLCRSRAAIRRSVAAVSPAIGLARFFAHHTL